MRVNRRELLYGMAAACVGPAVPTLSIALEKQAGLRNDAVRLRRRLEALSAYGRPAGGTFADGVSRVAYSDADVAGANYAMKFMREAERNTQPAAAGKDVGP